MGISSEREAELASLEPGMRAGGATAAPGVAIVDTFGFDPWGSADLSLLLGEMTFPRCDRCHALAVVTFLDADVRPARIREFEPLGELTFRYRFSCDCGDDEVETKFPLIAGRFSGDRLSPPTSRYPSLACQGEDVGESPRTDPAEEPEDPDRRTPALQARRSPTR